MLFPEPAWVCAYSMSMAYGEGRGFKPQPETKGRAMNNLITIALAISMKKAPTIGTMRKASFDGPKRLVSACMLAIAVGVAPRPKPQWPAAITAAS